jgi:hypothetical protein
MQKVAEIKVGWLPSGYSSHRATTCLKSVIAKVKSSTCFASSARLTKASISINKNNFLSASLSLVKSEASYKALAKYPKALLAKSSIPSAASPYSSGLVFSSLA